MAIIHPDLTKLIPHNIEEMQSIAAYRTSRLRKNINELNYNEKMKAVEEARGNFIGITSTIEYLHTFAGKHCGYQQWTGGTEAWVIPTDVDEITRAYENKYIPGLINHPSARIITSFYGINNLFT